MNNKGDEKMDDNQIIELYINRNEKAIQCTSEKYGNYCFSIANNILHNKEDSDEVVNDTYMGSWNSIPPHKPHNLSTFLGKITRNLSLKKWRHLHAQKRGGDEVLLAYEELSYYIPDENDLNKQLETQEISEIINKFLETLKETERKVFVCRYWYFDSISKISKQFSFSETKVRSMLYRTREKLAAALKKEGVYNEK